MRIPLRAFVADLARPLRLAFAVLSILAVTTAAAEFERGEVVIETREGQHRLSVEIARTPEELARGLMFRTELAPDHGMLFDFGTTRPVTMWMENTYIPLDILFLREDGRVRHIARDTTPLSRAPIPSEGPVRAALEVGAGTADRLGIRDGDRVRHPMFEDDEAP